jgi:flagellar basal-body rod modification protein FlgD
MVAVSSIDSSVLASVNQTSAAKSQSAADEIGTNFMTLLVAQLQNQDPLKPLENTELTSQLAQVNTVNGIENLNKALQGIEAQIGASQQLQASTLIGRGVMVAGDKILVGAEGVTTPFGFDLQRAAAEVSVSVISEAGEVIRRFDMGAMPAGSKTLVWDGLMEDGEIAPGGGYRFDIEAVDSSGQSVASEGLAYAVVNGVSMDASGEPILDLGGIAEPVLLGAVRQIL